MGLFDKFTKKEDTVNTSKEGENFISFVLLKEGNWDWDQYFKDLKEEWQIVDEEDGSLGMNAEYPETCVFSYEGCMIAISLVDSAVPGGEAEQVAQYNYMWKEAVQTVKEHKAHLIVSVLGHDVSAIKRGMLFVKAVSACCKQENTLGIYTSNCVFEPNFYSMAAEIMKQGQLPLLNWIWFGLYQNEKGVSCYTNGMNLFGRDEMEILNTKATPGDVRTLMLSVVGYVLEEDVILKHGETIGLSAKQKLPITRSKGVAIKGTTLKIEYQA